MAVTREKLFDTIANGAAWDAGVVFNRTNGIPIDKFSVFQTYELAAQYALTNPVAYPGQIIAVVPETGETTGYIILADGTLMKLATSNSLVSLAADIEALTTALQNSITGISNIGSVITYGKANGQTSSFNTTFVGTKAEYEAAYAEGKIPVGTIVVITDEEDDETVGDDVPGGDITSSILGVGVLGHLILG